MPPAPQVIKHHPSSVDLELVKRLAASTKVRAQRMHGAGLGLLG